MAVKDNRDRLEDAAQSSVQVSGLKGLSFRKLAEEVGIKSSSVHYYFPEKADLAQALIERYSEDMSQTLEGITQQRWGLKRKLDAYIEIFEHVSKNDRVCLCGMMAAEVESLNEDNKKLLDKFFNTMELWLVELFDANQDSIKSKLSSSDLSRAILSGLEGALLLDRVSSSQHHLTAQRALILSLI